MAPLPGLSSLPDDTARSLFIWLHIPLYAGLLWVMFCATWRLLAGRIFSIAMIAHAIAHFALSRHELYTFIPPIETITVYGAAFAGLTFLVLSFKGTTE